MAHRLTLEGTHAKAVFEVQPYPSGLPRNIEQCLSDYNIPPYFFYTVVDIQGRGRITGVTAAQCDETQKAGVDPELVFQAIKGGLAGSTVMNAKAPMMMVGNNKPGFKIDLHIKDLNNALDCAYTVGAPLPMTAEVQEVLQRLHNNDCGRNDHSTIARYYEKLTSVRIGR